MSLNFNPGASQRLVRAGGGVGGTLAYFAWVLPDLQNNNQRTIVRDRLVNLNEFRMWHYNQNIYAYYVNVAVLIINRAGAAASVWSGAASSHIGTSTNETNVWANANVTRGTFAANTSAGGELLIGANGFANYMDGKISHVGQWDLGLDDSEHIGLARGVSPRRVRPNNLAAYWELTGNYSPEPDFINKKWLTLVNGPTKYPERPVFRPLGVINVGVPGGVGPVTPGRNVQPLCPCCGHQSVANGEPDQ